MVLRTIEKKQPAAQHRKRTGQHHKRGRRYITPYWPYLPMVAIIGLSFLVNGWTAHANHAVLGYATDISVQNLLVGTNQQRSSNGENSLALNAQLDQAAQAKASDMAARDYWSHNTPDGQTPWTFITAVGYSYQTAGENLAYGFTTTADTITGWMNSPEHRANILNTSFVDVGFGIIDIANYQNSGPQTLVVAMYASPQVVPASAVTTPKTSTPIASAPTTAAATPETQATLPPPAAPQALPKDTPATLVAQSTSPAPEPKPQRLSHIQLVAGIGAGSAATILGLTIIALLLVRHSRAWHRVLRRGERFVLYHPALDVAGATVLALCLMLGQTSGLIR